ncbi:hypothetical protein ACFO0S_08335 [Chryseomicrobium palamuruense]|uniref:DUF304 domain-containing protein n=1 Tax=Chryseomicrobium palamuruense TaxID=682973 RepID=A0ABV8UWU5_9BACL
MLYKATMQRHFIWLLILLNSTSIPLRRGMDELLVLQLVVIAFLLMALLITFDLKIKENYLQYQMKFVKWTIYQKEIVPHEIRQITFSRMGWLKMGATIRVTTGWTVRIHDFSPDTVMVDLVEFVAKHAIDTGKTKDFLMLQSRAL